MLVIFTGVLTQTVSGAVKLAITSGTVLQEDGTNAQSGFALWIAALPCKVPLKAAFPAYFEGH